VRRFFLLEEIAKEDEFDEEESVFGSADERSDNLAIGSRLPI